MKSFTDFFELHNGGQIPVIGFGTYQADEQECYDSVREALKVGYRLIDTAALYRNEHAVGAAIRDSGIPRNRIFVTTKVWITDQGYDKTKRAFERSVDLLGLDYVDLYLIHWPIPTGHNHDYKELNAGSWKAMTEFICEGTLRFAGVSNFLPQHIEELMQTSDYLPVVNQIECHPGLNRFETVEYCKKKGIVTQAWRPIMKGSAEKMPLLAEIAKNHGCTASQICLSWLLARDICPIPKSVTPSRIKENIEVFDIKLSEREIELINDLPTQRLGPDPPALNK